MLLSLLAALSMFYVVFSTLAVHSSFHEVQLSFNEVQLSFHEVNVSFREVLLLAHVKSAAYV